MCLGWGGIACYTDTTPTQAHRIPKHIETRTHDQCDDSIEKSQAPDDGCVNVRNMLSVEEVKQNIITSDVKLVSYSSTITMMHGPIYIRLTGSVVCGNYNYSKYYGIFQFKFETILRE